MGTDDAKGAGADDGYIMIGRQPENRRQLMAKACWTVLWLTYLFSAVADLTGGRHTPGATALGWCGLAGFLVVYVFLLFGRRPRHRVSRRQLGLLAVLYGLAVLMVATLGAPWLTLLVYVSISSAVMLPVKWAARTIPAIGLTALGLGALKGAADSGLLLVVTAILLGGAAMTAVVQMGRTMRELREARATVAHLAANEERLRLARDLHDLLGHSLSLITLKSELAGRMLPDHPEQAARQVADIERVGRQALVDVREAVSGFRRPTLEGELAGARTALAAAGITAELGGAAGRHPDLGPDAEGALAWALREAVTNVVRHSGATRCEITLTEAGDEICLTVTDDGTGPAGPHGNGLTGLTERMALADGRLETGRARGGGFRLQAHAPLSRRTESVS
ncbi:sensor histidine kinase [Streptomyces caatingaensis]|uniref:Histidine kinase n=1 Tax=Streptomyces caatingaensis TaxID=1678637 RepID=A0A0K9XGH5_9ACTN|nr:sensor histidine kinase [Streptomyces caatingaensis]KNB51777.1 histidine kinase [Streptomyces caatingaensis]